MKQSLVQTERWENDSKQPESVTFFSFQGSGQTPAQASPSSVGEHLQSWETYVLQHVPALPRGVPLGWTSPEPHLREVHEWLLHQLSQLLRTWRISSSALSASQMSELLSLPLRLVQPSSGGNSFPPLVFTISFQSFAFTQKLHLSFYSLLTSPEP